MNSISQTTERFLPFREVALRTSISRAEIYRRVNAGTFPRPVSLGGSRVAFLEREVAAWIAQRIAERDTVPAGGAQA